MLRLPWGTLLGYVAMLYVLGLAAEYIPWSTPVAILGFLYYLPVYLLLLWAASKRALSVRTLFLFGVLVGLYVEAFITRLAWGSHENYQPFSPSILGFGSWELTYLCFFQHPLLSVGIPIFLAGHYLGMPIAVRLGGRPRRAILAALPVIMGLLSANLAANPILIVSTLVLNAAVLLGILAAYRRWGSRPAFSMSRWRLLFIAALAAFYIFAVPVRRSVPGPMTLILTVVLTLGVAWLTARSVAVDDMRAPASEHEHAPALSWSGLWRYLAYFVAALAVSYSAIVLLGFLGHLLVLALTLAGAALGTGYLVVCACKLLPARRPSPAGPIAEVTHQ